MAALWERRAGPGEFSEVPVSTVMMFVECAEQWSCCVRWRGLCVGMGDNRRSSTVLRLRWISTLRQGGLSGFSGTGRMVRRACLRLSLSGSNLLGFLPYALSRD